MLSVANLLVKEFAAASCIGSAPCLQLEHDFCPPFSLYTLYRTLQNQAMHCNQRRASHLTAVT
jgi:hypothetical protein